MMPDIIDKRAKLHGQVVNVNASSRLRLQKRLHKIGITIDCLTGDCWKAAAEIYVDNCENIDLTGNGFIIAGDVSIKTGKNPGWWQISSTSAGSKVKIIAGGKVESSPAFSAAYIVNGGFSTGIYAPGSQIVYNDGAFTACPGNSDLHFVVTPEKEDVRRELLHYSSSDMTTPNYDVLVNCDLNAAIHDSPLNDMVNNAQDIIKQTDAICWHQSLKTGRFYPPWDKYAPYMPALLLKTFKLSGLCEYGCRALLALAHLQEIGESAQGLTKNDSIILQSLQSLLSCENI